MTQPQDTTPANPAHVTDAMVEAAAKELLAHGEFSSIPGNNEPNARIAARAALTAAIGAGGQAVAWQGRDHPDERWQFLRKPPGVGAWAETRPLYTHPAPSGQAVAVEAVEPRKTFPILSSGGQKIDWQLVADHGEQAQKNHYQTVERLAQRGGLSWCELHAVLHNSPYRKMDTNDAIVACRELEARYLSAIAHPVQPGWREDKKMPQPKGD